MVPDALLLDPPSGLEGRLLSLALFEGLLAQPLWLQIWVLWLVVVNSASLAFLGHKAGRIVLGAWLVNIVLMTGLAELNGYNRLLGLSHVLAWTPLLVYLWRRHLLQGELAGASLFDRWARVLFATNLASLVVDCVDVVRYLAGER